MKGMQKTARRILLILAAVALMCSMSGCGKSQQKIYDEAQKLLADGNYGKAAEQFEKVTSISDAPRYAMYAKALQAAEDGNYSDAFTTLESLGDFADSSMYKSYLEARQAVENGGVQDLLHAKAIYESIPLFRDSKEQSSMIGDRIIELIGTNPVGVVEEGELVPFGEYDSQEIVWRALSVKDGKALLLSENAVSQMPYNKEDPESEEYKGWDECSLRDWLNGEFLQEAFSEEERPLIMQTQLKNNIFEDYERFDEEEQRKISRVITEGEDGVNYPDDLKEELYEEGLDLSYGSDTQDYVFLLGLNEAALYFDNDSDRILPEGASEEAEDSGSYYRRQWWLRDGMASAFSVDEEGQLSTAYRTNMLSVRPAIYVPVLTGEAREAVIGSIYDEACELFEKDTLEELERAQKLFECINPYEDSESRLETLEEKRMEAAYNKACALAESDTIEELEEAQELFEGIISYKDSESKLEMLKDRMEEARLKAVYDEAGELVNGLALVFIHEIAKWDSLDTLEPDEAYGQLLESMIDLTTYENSESWLEMLRCELQDVRQRAAYDDDPEPAEVDTLKELYEAYVQLLESMIIYEDSTSTVEMSKDKVQDAILRAVYDEACELAEKDTLEELATAFTLFESITSYEDSESRMETLQDQEKVMEACYSKACELAESDTVEKLELAQELFEEITPYEDSESRLEEVEEKLAGLRNKADYDKACELAESDTFGELKEAQALFEGITPYEDSESKLTMIKRKIQDLMDELLAPLKNASVGDHFQFGMYADDAISWRILAREDDRVLLISDTALEVKPYHDTDEETSWAECSLREWLNNDFLERAFTEEEQACILVAVNNNEGDPDYYTYAGEQTQDKVFLLSTDEAEKYFRDDEDRIVYGATSHVEENGAYMEEDGSVYWWLRSAGYVDYDDTYTAAVVSSEGYIYSEDVTINNNCVRPALWIGLSYTEGIEELETDYAVFEEPFTN